LIPISYAKLFIRFISSLHIVNTVSVCLRAHRGQTKFYFLFCVHYSKRRSYFNKKLYFLTRTKSKKNFALILAFSFHPFFLPSLRIFGVAPSNPDTPANLCSGRFRSVGIFKITRKVRAPPEHQVASLPFVLLFLGHTSCKRAECLPGRCVHFSRHYLHG